jgi:hypothetical protein
MPFIEPFFIFTLSRYLLRQMLPIYFATFSATPTLSPMLPPFSPLMPPLRRHLRPLIIFAIFQLSLITLRLILPLPFQFTPLLLLPYY